MKRAEELIKKFRRGDNAVISNEVELLMIGFAKMHVEAFKKEIKDKAWHMCEDDGWDWHVEVDRVSNLYPLENII